jgi:hypothetical protein
MTPLFLQYSDINELSRHQNSGEYIVVWRLKAGLIESRRAPSAKQRHPNATEKQLANPRQRI